MVIAADQDVGPITAVAAMVSCTNLGTGPITALIDNCRLQSARWDGRSRPANSIASNSEPGRSDCG